MQQQSHIHAPVPVFSEHPLYTLYTSGMHAYPYLFSNFLFTHQVLSIPQSACMTVHAFECVHVCVWHVRAHGMCVRACVHVCSYARLRAYLQVV